MSPNHSSAFVQICEDALTRVSEVSTDDVLNHINDNVDFVLIDVREESEWQAGHIPQAIHLSKGVIERDIEKHVQDKDKKLVLYCGGGYRSALAADNLQKMGYSQVFSMAGGMRKWRELGYTVVS